MLDYIRKSSNDTITCPSCREMVPVHTVDDYINTDTLEKDWYFDFDDIVENRTDKEFRADQNVHNDESSDKDDGSSESGSDASESGSDAGSESGSEGSDDSSDDNGCEQSEEDSEEEYSDE